MFIIEKTSSKVTSSCHILVKRRKSPTDGRKESIAICDRLPGVECGRNLMKCFDAHLTSARSACLEQRHLGLIGVDDQDGFHEWPSFSMIPHSLFLIHQIMLVSFKFSAILSLSLSSLTLTPALTASYQMYHYQRQRAKCFIFYFFSKIYSLNSFIAIPRLNPSFPRSKAPKIARGPGLSQRRTRRPRPPLRTTKTHPDADDSNEDLRLARIMSETRNW